MSDAMFAGSANSVLESLLRGEVPRAAGSMSAPPSALGVFSGALEPAHLDPAERWEVLSSWLGAGVLVRFVPLLAPEDLCSAVLSLRFAPIGLPRVLDRLAAVCTPGLGALAVQAPAHLEVLLNELDEPLSRQLSSSLGLPGALGRVIDLVVLAVESGGSSPSSPSAAQPLLVTLDRLGAKSVWELLPAGSGSLARYSPEVPLDVLAATAEALNLLGAPATTLRLLVLLLLLGEPSRVEDAQRRLLTRLALSQEARVPVGRVVDAWSLANR